jgi:hypothetical protein
MTSTKANIMSAMTGAMLIIGSVAAPLVQASEGCGDLFQGLWQGTDPNDGGKWTPLSRQFSWKIRYKNPVVVIE